MFIDSTDDFASEATFFSKSKQPAAAAQTAQFIMVPNMNGQFISPTHFQQPQTSGQLIAPIIVEATATPALRLPQISLNVASPVRQIGFAVGQTAPLITNQPVINQPAPLTINPMLAAALLAGGGPAIPRARLRGRGRGRGGGGRGRGRGQRRRRPQQMAITAARFRQAALMSALQMQQASQQLQATSPPSMQILQPIIVQAPEASAAPVRQVETEKVRTVVQPVVQPIVAQPISLPVRYEKPVSSSSYESSENTLSHSGYHQIPSRLPPHYPPSYTRVRHVQPSSHYGYTAGSSYYRTPSGGIVNQIVIQPPSANANANGLLKKTRKKMRAKAIKKLIKMIDE